MLNTLRMATLVVKVTTRIPSPQQKHKSQIKAEGRVIEHTRRYILISCTERGLKPTRIIYRVSIETHDHIIEVSTEEATVCILLNYIGKDVRLR